IRDSRRNAEDAVGRAAVGRAGEADRAASVAEVAMLGAAAVAKTHAARFAILRAAMDAAMREEIVVVREGARGTAAAVASRLVAGRIVQVHRPDAESEEENSISAMLQTYDWSFVQ
ncbi:MAG: hypothetical protein AAB224_01595, partial [Gemmatimonadota bacterium]